MSKKGLYIIETYLIVARMKRLFVYLFVAFCLMLSPIAHASGMNCEGDNCQMTQKSEKQDDGKMANAGHHHCCPHFLTMPNLTVAEPITVSSRTVFVLEQDATTSVVVGSPLKPPSHA